VIALAFLVLSAVDPLPVAVPLERGRTVERQLSGGQSHSYRIELNPGDFARVIVSQCGIGVSLTVFSPDSKTLVELDVPTGTRGVEKISWVGAEPGVYRLDVGSSDAEAMAASYEIRLDELRPHTELDVLEARADLALAEGERLRDQDSAESNRKALEQYALSLRLSREVGDRSTEGLVLYCIGRTQNALNQPREALESYTQSLAVRRSEDDRSGLAFSLFGRGSVEAQLGQPSEALQDYAEAQLLARSVGDGPLKTSILTNIGILYDSIGERRKALEQYSVALPLTRAMLDRVGETRVLISMGFAYDSLGERQKALGSYRQAIELCRVLKDQKAEAISLSYLGKTYSDLGDWELSQHYFKEALQTVRTTGDRRAEAIMLVLIGRTQASQGSLGDAAASYREAIDRFQEMEDRRTEAAALISMAEVSSALGQHEQAVDALNHAVGLSRAVGDRWNEASALSNLGSVLLSQGKADRAFELLQAALPLRRAVGDRLGEAGTMIEIARAERDRGSLAAAQEQAEAALDLVESLRTEVASYDLRSSFFGTVQKHYGFTIDLMARRHRVEPRGGFDARAFEASERARARSLMDVLTEPRAEIREGADPALLEREHALQNLIRARIDRQARLLAGGSRDQVEAIAAEIERSRAEYQELEAQIRAASPRYAALTQPQPLALADIQHEVLDHATILLEYFLGEDRSFLWAVTPASLTMRELPPRSEIEAAARKLQEGVSSPAGRKGFSEGATLLGRMLLAPVADLLSGKRVCVVADGLLQYVPFGALPDPSSRGGTIPLARSHEIVSLPSASVLALLRNESRGRKLAPRTIALFADPVFAADDPRVRHAGQRRPADRSRVRDFDLLAGGASLSRLPFTRREAHAILGLVAPEDRLLALDFDANLAAARSSDLDRYRYVHFATHGLINTSRPELSGIVLSLVDRKGGEQEGFLSSLDIFNLKLQAEVVVLSACRTALGKEVRGEGLVGLTRSFMYAGTPRVVASLWRVDDAATAELMKRFYQGMLGPRKLRPAAALREAQLAVAKQKRWQDPYYWAAFVLQGEWN
jgi:CHAT domain-containing protein/tetratricopeptide (TPR) repeat protein